MFLLFFVLNTDYDSAIFYFFFQLMENVLFVMSLELKVIFWNSLFIVKKSPKPNHLYWLDKSFKQLIDFQTIIKSGLDSFPGDQVINS